MTKKIFKSNILVAAAVLVFGISAPAYAKDTIDSSNQSEQLSNANEYIAE